MPDEIRSILIKKYTDEINYLQDYLGINLQHWLDVRYNIEKGPSIQT